MLLQALHCSFSHRLFPKTSQTVCHSINCRQNRCPVSTAASREMEVLAAAEAVLPELEGLRLDAALPVLFPGRWKSTTALKRTVRRGEVLVNGDTATTDHPLKLSDRVEVVTPLGAADCTKHNHKLPWRQQLPGLDVAFEDDHMAVVIKPQGLLSQGPKGAASVAGRVKYCLNPTPLPGALAYPAIVHRLDVGTGGLLMVAKTRAVAAKLSLDLKEHNMQKRYLALVLGRLTGSGVIDHPVSGCAAVTLFKVEGHRPSASFGCLTLVSLWPKTGRTHQLRKHMAYIDHPILGDLQYKHHRKPECQPVHTNITNVLPQLSGSACTKQWETAVPDGPADAQQAVTVVELSCCNQDNQHKQLQQQVNITVAPNQQPPSSTPDWQYQHEHTLQAAAQHRQVVTAEHIVSDLPVFSRTSFQHAMQTLHGSSTSSAGSSCEEGVDEDCADASSTAESASSSCRQRGEMLQDGTVVGTCLWAVQLQLNHPVTGQHLDISVGDAPTRLYDTLCERDAAVQA